MPSVKKPSSLLLEDILIIARRFDLSVRDLGNFQVEIVDDDDRLLYSGPIEQAFRYMKRYQRIWYLQGQL